MTHHSPPTLTPTPSPLTTPPSSSAPYNTSPPRALHSFRPPYLPHHPPSLPPSYAAYLPSPRHLPSPSPVYPCTSHQHPNHAQCNVSYPSYHHKHTRINTPKVPTPSPTSHHIPPTHSKNIKPALHTFSTAIHQHTTVPIPSYPHPKPNLPHPYATTHSTRTFHHLPSHLTGVWKPITGSSYWFPHSRA